MLWRQLSARNAAACGMVWEATLKLSELREMIDRELAKGRDPEIVVREDGEWLPVGGLGDADEGGSKVFLAGDVR